MKKCIVTGEDTNMLTKGLPLSRGGRKLVDEKLIEYNVLLKEQFFKVQKRKNDTITDDLLEEICPKVKKGFFLRLINNKTLDGAFSELREYGKEKVEKEDSVESSNYVK